MCENFLGKYPHNEVVEMPFALPVILQSLVSPVNVKIKAILPQSTIVFEVGVLGDAKIEIDMKKLPVNKESALEFYVNSDIQEFIVDGTGYTRFRIFSEITI